MANNFLSDKKIFLLDALSMIYRAYFALIKTPLYNKDGLNTSAIYGFANILLELLKIEKPSHLAVIFDSEKPTFREQEFVQYKAQREPMPEDIKLAIPQIIRFLKILQIPVLQIDGYEADDVIGTIAYKAAKEDFLVYIVSTDKDFGQLLSEKIFLYKPGNNKKPKEILSSREIFQKYRIANPKHIIDILALWGDASDNIPGVPGIGEKYAIDLVSQFGTIENIIQKIDNITNKRISNLIKDNYHQALLSKQLITIDTDVPIEFDEEMCKWNLPDLTPLINFFNEMDFRSLSKRFIEAFYSESSSPPVQQHGIQFSLFDTPTNVEKVNFKIKTFDSSQVSYTNIQTIDQLYRLQKILLDTPVFSFDTETTGLNIFRDKIIGISFSDANGRAYYVSFTSPNLSKNQIYQLLQPVFQQKNCLKIAHNIKFDLHILERTGFSIEGPIFDTMVAFYLLDPEGRHNLDYLSELYLKYRPITFQELLKGGKPTPENILNIPIQQLSDYACEDADITLQLYQIAANKLEQENMNDLFYNIEMPLVFVLKDMESAGVNIDVKELQRYGDELRDKLKNIEQKIHQIAGVQFNIQSARQLGEVLFEQLKISDKPTRTKTKQYATSEEILKQYINKHPIVPFILQHRMYHKLLNTYIETLPKYKEDITGRIHASFHQTVTATGRLSSSNPNLQNIPIRTELGQEIRKAFIPKNENYLLMSADYSQIELRVMAAISNEKSMIEDFRNGYDIHKTTAARIFQLPVEDIGEEHRRKAKTVNFGIIYGISAHGLSQRLGISRKESEKIIEEYFKKYPAIQSFMQETINFAHQHGYVNTIMLRKRYISNLHSSNAIVRGFAERAAINTPIQGSAADIMKLAMINIHDAIKRNKMKSQLIMQVHDELIFDAEITEIEQLSDLVEIEMKKAYSECFPSMPIEINIKNGKNWFEAH